MNQLKWTTQMLRPQEPSDQTSTTEDLCRSDHSDSHADSVVCQHNHACILSSVYKPLLSLRGFTIIFEIKSPFQKHYTYAYSQTTEDST